jgi:peptidyl-prolyl cis-trans isomerase C
MSHPAQFSWSPQGLKPMILRRLCVFAVLVTLAAATRLSAQTSAADKTAPAPDSSQHVVLSVNDAKYTEADVAKILESLPPDSRQFYAVQGRHLLPQYLVRMKVLAEEARKQKLDEQPEVRRAIEIAVEGVLADVERQRVEESVAAPADLVMQLYQARKKDLEQVHLRRLLIRTDSSILSQSSTASKPALSSELARKKLEEIRQKIVAGADFAAMAQASSDDPESASKGGDLGFVSYRAVIPPVSQAAMKLSAGQVSEIIPTPFGMEIYQVVEKRTQPLDEIRPQLEAMIRQGNVEEKMQEIQSGYKIFVDSQYFAPPTDAAPTAPFGAPATTTQ